MAYKGIWNRASVIEEIAGNFKNWVVGHTYQQPAHESYADTVAIIQAVRLRGVKVYGYVPLGVTSFNFSQAQLGVLVDQWNTIGVDGIFIDEFGFDYGNTRTRQKTLVDYVHSLSLPIVANAWTIHDFLCDNVSELPFPSDDWRYVNFTTRNPTNIALTRTASDIYLFENFCYSDVGATNMFDLQERAAVVRALAATKNVKVWALAVFGETVPGTLDTSKLGSFTDLENVGAYISSNAYLYDFKVVGSGGFSFGSGGSPIWAPLYDLPPLASAPEGATVANYTTGVFTRNFGDVNITVLNNVIQKVTATGDVARVIAGDFPKLFHQVYVAPTAPASPYVNQIWIQS